MTLVEDPSLGLSDEELELLEPEDQAEYLRLVGEARPDRWVLFPKQEFAEALWNKVGWLLYGGAAGGAKSELALWHANRLSQEIPGHVTLLIRRSIPDLRRSLILRMIARSKQYRLGARYTKPDGQSQFSYPNGALIECGHCARDEDVAKYLSAEYGCIIIDEASQLTLDQVTQLQARLRTTKSMEALGVRPHLGLFTNPGDRGHEWLYQTFVAETNFGDRVVVYNVANGFENRFPVRYYDAPCQTRDASPAQIRKLLVPWAKSLDLELDEENELAVAFLQSRAQDNPHLAKGYKARLNALPELKRRQMRDGDWDTFEGQYFEEWNRDLHVVPPFVPAEGWPLVRALDYGSTAPFGCLWIAWDNDGDAWVYREAYAPGMTPVDQARMVESMSQHSDDRGQVVREKYMMTVADPSVFSNHRGVGKTVADLWAQAGLVVAKARNERVGGWQQVRQYLWDSTKHWVDDAGAERVGGPRLFISSDCVNLIRTLPTMMRAKGNPEDLNSVGTDDHLADCLRYGLGVRPLGAPAPRQKLGQTLDQRFSAMLKGRDRKTRRF